MIRARSASCLTAFALAASGCEQGAPDQSTHIEDPMRNGIVDAMLARTVAWPAEGQPGGFAIVHRRPAAVSIRAWRGTGEPLRASLGRAADAPMRFDGIPVSVARVGANRAEGTIDRGAVFFRDAFPGVDSYVFATELGVEDLVVVRHAGSEPVYAVDFPDGWYIDAVSPSLVVLRDHQGVSRLRVAVPRAWDASGAAVSVVARVEESRIRLSLDPAAEMPVVIDPEWTTTTVPAVARAGHTATLLGDGRVLLAAGDMQGVAEVYDPARGTFDPAGTLAEPPRYFASASLLRSGRVFIAGGQGAPRMALPSALTDIFDIEANAFLPGPQLETPRSQHLASLLGTGAVLLAGGLDSMVAGTATASLVTPDATTVAAIAGSLATARVQPGAVTLPSGRVLIVGGGDQAAASADLYDPATGTFQATGSLVLPRTSPSLTLLASGEVLVVGGRAGGEAEIYHPSSGVFIATGSTMGARTFHTATLLPTGHVLIAGGYGIDLQTTLASTEVYDPETQTFTLGPSMPGPRAFHRAVLLPSGRVLVTGGFVQFSVAGEGALQQALIFDPDVARIRSSSIEPRTGHQATLLASGEVLFTGGTTGSTRSEIYDPFHEVFTPAGMMTTPRTQHTATLLESGKVLLVGGKEQQAKMSAELFDPVTQTFSAAAAPQAERVGHAAVRLASGNVLVIGGDAPTNSTEIYDPVADTFTTGPQTSQHRFGHTATLLDSGKVFVTGQDPPLPPPESPSEIYDPTKNAFTDVATSSWGRWFHTATRLLDGRVLVVGDTLSGSPFDETGARVFDPTTLTFGPDLWPEPAMWAHTAALLSSGEVLVAGGSFLGSAARRIDPGVGAVDTGSMKQARYSATATTLLTGKVLIVGGGTQPVVPPNLPIPDIAEAELYDPQSGTFDAVGSLVGPRSQGTATVLSSGLVLLAGGSQDRSESATTTTVLFNPIDGSHVAGPSLGAPRAGHTATLLRSGKVLLTGGSPAAGAGLEPPQVPSQLASSEIFDPQRNTFAAAASLIIPRLGHSATTLPSGKVVIIGGTQTAEQKELVELYDPEADSFATIGSTETPRAWHGAALLSDGRVFVMGGRGSNGFPVSSAEIFDPALGTSTVLVGAPSIPGRTYAAPLPNGDVIVVGDGAAYRFLASVSAIQPIDDAPPGAAGAATLFTGDVVACGRELCSRFEPGSAAFTGAFLAPLDDPGATLAVLPTSNVLIVGRQPATQSPQQFSFGAIPLDVVRPVLADAPPTIVIGSSIELHGQRFQRRSAAFATAGATPEVTPVAFLMPAEGGGPLFGSVTDRSDTSLSWKVPLTVRTGPAWMYVAVDGVPSLGRFVIVQGAPLATPCSAAGTCASGFCVDGVCCNEACSSQCSSCLARHHREEPDGTCAPVLAGTDPHGACDEDPTGTCGQTGACDGTAACARDPDGSPCANSGVCSGGSCAIIGICDGDHIVDEPAGPRDCSPYRCSPATGACLDRCLSTHDCAGGSVCSAGGRCEPPIDVGPEAGCATSPASRTPWASAAALAAALIAVALRRGRRARPLPQPRTRRASMRDRLTELEAKLR